MIILLIIHSYWALKFLLTLQPFLILLIRLWDVRTGNVIRTLETKSPVTSAEVSQDGRYITTADGFSVKFWDANQ